MKKPKIPLLLIPILGFVILMVCFFFINNMFLFGIVFLSFGSIILLFYKKNLVKSLYEELADSKFMKLTNIETKIVIKSTLSYLQDTVDSDIILTENNIFIIPLSSVVNKIF